jgi:hypothetical protein
MISERYPLFSASGDGNIGALYGENRELWVDYVKLVDKVTSIGSGLYVALPSYRTPDLFDGIELEEDKPVTAKADKSDEDESAVDLDDDDNDDNEEGEDEDDDE